MSDKNQQLEIAERLQLKWLERMETLLNEGTITSTDMATLARLLMSNGWTLDPSRLPQGIREKLTSLIDPSEFDEGDADVLPLRRQG